jgi:hypothetical protein
MTAEKLLAEKLDAMTQKSEFVPSPASASAVGACLERLQRARGDQHLSCFGLANETGEVPWHVEGPCFYAYHHLTPGVIRMHLGPAGAAYIAVRGFGPLYKPLYSSSVDEETQRKYAVEQVRFLLSDHSPWRRTVTPHLVFKDPDEVCDHGGFILERFTEIDASALYTFAQSTRFSCEHPGYFQSYLWMRDHGADPGVAYLLAHWAPNPSRDHVKLSQYAATHSTLAGAALPRVADKWLSGRLCLSSKIGEKRAFIFEFRAKQASFYNKAEGQVSSWAKALVAPNGCIEAILWAEQLPALSRLMLAGPDEEADPDDLATISKRPKTGAQKEKVEIKKEKVKIRIAKPKPEEAEEDLDF